MKRGRLVLRVSSAEAGYIELPARLMRNSIERQPSTTPLTLPALGRTAR